MSYASTPSATTFAADKGTVFKVTIERGGEPEMRRVRGDFTFEEMLSIIRHMWNSAPERLVIEYVDEDGDRVRVGSQLEWTEAIQVHADRNERTVRLFARKGTKRNCKGSRGDSAPAAAAAAEDSDVEIVENGSRKTTPAVAPRSAAPSSVPPLKLDGMGSRAGSTDSSTGPGVKSPFQTAMDACAAFVGHVVGDRAVPPPVEEEGTEYKATLSLLSELFRCDAAKELGNAFSTIDFRPVVARKANPVTCEMEVDVDKQHLRRLLVSVTNRWIGEGKYENAERNLLTALTLWPDDSLLLYNLACAQSLCGELTKSIESLSMAITHGYNDAGNMLRDADLNNVKEHPDFAGLLRRARGQATPAGAPVVESADVHPMVDVHPAEVVVVPTPVAAAAPLAELTQADKLIAVFPYMTTLEAEALLRACGGNLQSAVNMQLSQ